METTRSKVPPMSLEEFNKKIPSKPKSERGTLRFWGAREVGGTEVAPEVKGSVVGKVPRKRLLGRETVKSICIVIVTASITLLLGSKIFVGRQSVVSTFSQVQGQVDKVSSKVEADSLRIGAIVKGLDNFASKAEVERLQNQINVLAGSRPIPSSLTQR